jgi:ribosomal protein S24E
LEFKVVAERDNKFLDRVEIEVEVEHSGSATPRREDIYRFVVDKLSLDASKCLIKKIVSGTGVARSRALIYYFPNGIDWSQIEPIDRGKVMVVGEEETEAQG